ncbi:mechanosensitive ion channel [Acetobacteraceae bacterium]|nr:mechanosensitive ion channel [Acetobacteraceae bacterium]
MLRLRRIFFFQIAVYCLISILSIGGGLVSSAYADEAKASPPLATKTSQPVLDATEAKDLISILNDPEQRDKLVATLKSLEKVQSTNLVDMPHSILESVLQTGRDLLHKVSEAFHAFIAGIANFKALLPWLLQVWNDPALQSEIVRICLRVAVVGLGGWGLSYLLSYLFRGVRGKIKEKAKDLALRAEEAQQTLDLAKQEADDDLAEAAHLEEVLAKTKREMENALKEETLRQEQLSQTEQNPQETLAHAENLAARQALEEVENQAIVAQTMALSDSPAVKAPILNLTDTKDVGTDNKASLSSENSQKDFHQEKPTKVHKAVLEAEAKIKQLEETYQKIEDECRHAKEAAQQAQKKYDDVRQNNQKANLFSRWRRTPYALAGFSLDLFGIAMFPFLALLIQILDPTPDARTMEAVWSVTWFANVVQTLWVAVLRVLFNPADAWLRIAAISDQAAKFLFKWLRRISGFVAWSLTIIIIFQACTLPGSVSSAIGKLVGLFANLMLARMILGARPYVARSCLMVANRTPKLATISNLVRQLWWIVALFFDIALWWVWAMNMRDGYQLIFWVFIKTCVALIAARLLWLLIQYFLDIGDLWIRKEDNLSAEMQERFLRYYPALQKMLGTIVLVVMFIFIAMAWGVPASHIFASNALGRHILSSGSAILVSLAVGVFIWEGANIFFDRQSKKLLATDSGEKQRAARIRTLQPLLKIILLIVLIATIGMTILSELGVNIAPLLASASIFGVAIGFGSQKLVHDFISGVFLLLENALSVGDAVTLNKTYGRVEKLSLRTVHVRSGNGSLNIFPFSSLNEITNYSRGFCRVVIEANVAYDTKVEDVHQVYLEITESLNNDPKYADYIIDALDFWGLDHFNESTLCIKATLPVTPAGRWPVTYEFNRRICEAFEKRGIKMPFPMRTVDFPSLEAFLKSEDARSQPFKA